MTKIIAYSYNGKVNAVEINEEDIEKFVTENEEELDKDLSGESAYSIYNTRTGAELAKILFTNSYMTEYEIVEIEA